MIYGIFTLVMLVCLLEYNSKDLHQFIDLTGDFQYKVLLMDRSSKVIHLLSTDDEGDDCLFRLIKYMVSSSGFRLCLNLRHDIISSLVAIFSFSEFFSSSCTGKLS